MPSLQTSATVHEVTVLDRRELVSGASTIVVIGVYAPELVRVTRPGQFVMAIPPGGKNAAVALGIYEAQGERAALMFFVVGSRTRELARLREGDTLGLTGPLGNGFDLSARARDVAIVAGGVGIASVLLAAQAAVRSGARVRLYYGARTQRLLVETQTFAASGCEVICATDDGSYGEHGMVTDVLASSGERPELILACGPAPMLRAVAELARRMDVPAQLSLEEQFACGVGGCWGCVVPIDRASAQAPGFPRAQAAHSAAVYARVCKEGPVFWAHELRW